MYSNICTVYLRMKMKLDFIWAKVKSCLISTLKTYSDHIFDRMEKCQECEKPDSICKAISLGNFMSINAVDWVLKIIDHLYNWFSLHSSILVLEHGEYVCTSSQWYLVHHWVVVKWLRSHSSEMRAGLERGVLLMHPEVACSPERKAHSAPSESTEVLRWIILQKSKRI